MSEIVGRVEKVFIAPVAGVPAATVDGYIPEELRVGMSGLSVHGVETQSFQVRSARPADEPVDYALLAGLSVDIRYDRLQLAHPERGVVSIPTTIAQRHRHDTAVDEYLQAIVGDGAHLAGPMRRADVSPVGSVRQYDDADRYGVLRMAVTAEPAGILYEEALPQPVFPGIDVVLTGLNDAFHTGQHVIVRQPTIERYTDFSGWVTGTVDCEVAGQVIRMADVQYHSAAEFGSRVAIGSDVRIEVRQ
jgi:hypothetical protein